MHRRRPSTTPPRRTPIRRARTTVTSISRRSARWATRRAAAPPWPRRTPTPGSPLPSSSTVATRLTVSTPYLAISGDLDVTGYTAATMATRHQRRHRPRCVSLLSQPGRELGGHDPRTPGTDALPRSRRSAIRRVVADELQWRREGEGTVLWNDLRPLQQRDRLRLRPARPLRTKPSTRIVPARAGRSATWSVEGPGRVRRRAA